MIEIKVIGDTAKEVFTDLRELTAQTAPVVSQEAVQAVAEAVANPATPVAEKPKPAPKAKPAPKPAPMAEEPAKEETPKAETVDIKDVQVLLGSILRDKPELKKDAVKVLSDFGVKKLAELDADDLPAVKAALESLGD